MERERLESPKIENPKRIAQIKRAKNSLKKKKRKPSRFHKQNSIIQKLAIERIEFLMETAIKIYSKNPELANRYVDLARRYSMSAKMKIPTQFKSLICHNCKKLLLPGISSRHRIQSRKKRGTRYVVTCLNCNHTMHLYFKQKIPRKSEC